MALTKIKLNTMVTGNLPDANIPNNITISNAGTATALETARTINGTSFDGSANITVTSAAGTLTGNTLASGVTASSLTSVGTLTGLTTGAITQNAGTLTIKNASSDSNGLKIYQDSGDASKIYNHYNGTLELGVGSTTALTIDSSENSTFAGTTTTFPVGGVLRFGERGNLTHNSSNYNMTFNTNSLANALVITGTGSVGINEDAPTTKLDLRLDSTSTDLSNDYVMFINNQTGASSGRHATIGFGTYNNGGLTNVFGAVAEGTGAQSGFAFLTHNGGALTEKVRISNAGRVGIGTDSPASLLHVKTTSNVSETVRIQNDDSLTTVGVSSDGYSFHTYQHSLYLASWDGSTWSTKGKIDGNGNQVIGTGDREYDWGSERRSLTIKSVDNAGANNYGVLEIVGHSINNDGALGAIHFYDHGSSNASIQVNRQNNSGSAKMMFSTSESGGNKKARMTIYDAGAVLIDNDTSGSPAQLTVQNDGSTGWLGTWLVLNSKNHSNRGAGVTMHNQAADKGFFTGCIYQSGFDKWSICFEGRNYADQTTADSDHEVLHVNYDGAAYNDQNTWGSSSDERIKNSIVDSNSQWDDIKALKIKNYKLNKHGEDAPTLIGVIAQDLEKSGMNGLIDETEADELQIARYEDINKGDKIKSVKYSVLYMKAIKALQEAMERIEALENA